MRNVNLFGAAIAAAVLVAGSSLQAAVIAVAPNGASAGDRTLVSDTSRGSETGTTMQVGEQTGDGTPILKSYVPFAISASDKADLATTGSTATLFLRLSGFTNVTNATFSVVGYTNRGTDVIGTPGDYSTSATTAVVTDVPIGTGIYNLDVTAFVKAQAALTGNTAIVFRIESGTGLVKTDTLTNQLLFKTGDNATIADRPTLTISVPEPTSLAGVGLLSAALLRRRRAAK